MDKIADYAERVYAFAVGHTFSQDEADELSQEILFTAVREWPKLRDETRFEPWLWGIAGNVAKAYRRQRGKQRAMFSFDSLENMPGPADETAEAENREQYSILREKIAMLSAAYRDILILYYYDGLSTKQIARKLGIPEGTVTWRLAEARGRLKKECENMTETALRPVAMTIRISGDGDYNGTTIPFPYVYINDALSQNILYYCYDRPKTAEELAHLCGVPAFYIEERLANLVSREAVSALPKGRYRTEFLIYSDKTDEYMEKNRRLFEPVTAGFIAALNGLAEETAKLGHYTAGKPADELLYLYGMLALEHLSDRYNPVAFTGYPVRYDGGRWSYHAHLLGDRKHPARGLGRECSMNLGSRGHYSHIAYHFGGFTYRGMMYDNEINICEDILTGKEITDKASAAAAIEKGYVERKEDGELVVTTPAFTLGQKKAFNSLVDSWMTSAVSLYAKAVDTYAAGYKKQFPAHLEREAGGACHYLFLSLYATLVCDTAREKGLLKPPPENSFCDVLLQFK